MCVLDCEELLTTDGTFARTHWPSSAFVIFAYTSNRSSQMRFSRTVSAFAAVVDAHRSCDPVDRGDDVLTAEARSSKYTSKERHCIYTCATADVIPGLKDDLVAITARALMANSPHVVCGRVAQLTFCCLSTRASSSRPPPPPTSTTCVFFLCCFLFTTSACVSTRECVYVHQLSCLWWA